MPHKDDVVYLSHVRDAITKIEIYTKGIEHDSFINNSQVQDSVIRQLEIIGEASKKISPELKTKYLTVPWKSISGMRDKLIHDYFGVDIDAVWDTVRLDIPKLKLEVEKALVSLR